MNKPQVNMTITVSCKDLLERTPTEWESIHRNYRNYLIRLLSEYANEPEIETDEKPAKQRNEVPTSRHHQSVAANTRIMDAIEFINKEMRLLKGHSENGTLKVFEELKSILLGI